MMKKVQMFLSGSGARYFLLGVGLFLLAFLMRLEAVALTPLLAIGLYGAYKFRRFAFMALLIPLMAMFMSDLFINPAMLGGGAFIYPGMAFNYLAILGVVFLGFQFFRSRRRLPGRVVLSGVSGSFLFFLVSNLGVYLSGTMYPLTGGGLVACYIAGLPFLVNHLLATLFWGGLLFGADALVSKRKVVSSAVSM